MKIEFNISEIDFSRLQRFGLVQPGQPSPAKVVENMVSEFLATPGGLTAREMVIEAVKKQGAAETKLRDTQERLWATETRLARADDEVKTLTRQIENLKVRMENLRKRAGLLREGEGVFESEGEKTMSFEREKPVAKKDIPNPYHIGAQIDHPFDHREAFETKPAKFNYQDWEISNMTRDNLPPRRRGK